MATSYMKTGSTNQSAFSFLSKLVAHHFGPYPMMIYKVNNNRGKIFAVNTNFSPRFRLHPSEVKPVLAMLGYEKHSEESPIVLEHETVDLNFLNSVSNKDVLYVDDINKLKLKNIVEVYETIVDGKPKLHTVNYQDRSVFDIIINAKGQIKEEVREIYSMRDGQMIKIWQDQSLFAGEYFGPREKVAVLCEEVLLNGTIDLLEVEENPE